MIKLKNTQENNDKKCVKSVCAKKSQKNKQMKIIQNENTINETRRYQ